MRFLFLFLLIISGANTLWSQTQAVRIPLQEPWPNTGTISSRGNCFAYHIGSLQNGFDKSVVFVLDPSDPNPTPRKVPLATTKVAAMRCLDDGLWIHHMLDKSSELVHLDLETFKLRVVLRSGTMTNLGVLGSIVSFSVDNKNPDNKFVFTDQVGTGYNYQGMGLHRVANDGTLTEAFTKEGIGVAGFSKDFLIRGSEVFFKGTERASAFEPTAILKVNLETKALTVLFKAGDKRNDGRILTSYFALSGDTVVITTATKIENERAKEGGVTHVLRIPPGETLSEHTFKEGLLPEVLSVPIGTSIVGESGVFLSSHSNWGPVGFQIIPPNGNEVRMSDGTTLLEVGDLLAGETIEFIGGPPTSSRTHVAMLPPRRVGSGYGADLFLISPAPGPCSPEFSKEGVRNAASGTAGAIAPLMWISIFGTCLEPPEGGIVTILINGQEVAPHYVSPTQINFLTPEFSTEGEVRLSVVHRDKEGAEVAQSIIEVILPSGRFHPGLFQHEERIIVSDNETWALHGENNPTASGKVVVLWGTGFDESASIAATLGGKAVEMLYVGPSSFPGLTQINLLIPQGAKNGEILVTEIEGVRFEVPIHLTE